MDDDMRAFRGARARPMSLGEYQAALAAARREAMELNDRYTRAAAALENARKQADRDAARQVAERVRAFGSRLLEVADNLERALAHAPEGGPLRTGVQATLQQLTAALRQEGIAPLAVRPGDPFDPRVHEALGGHEGDVAAPTVAEVAQTGYTLDGQLLRPAQVTVVYPPRAR